jgi:hypothetical protein
LGQPFPQAQGGDGQAAALPAPEGPDADACRGGGDGQPDWRSELEHGTIVREEWVRRDKWEL